MRRVICGAFLSLDGVMQAPGGPDEDREGGFAHGGWTVPYWDDAMGRFMDSGFSQPFDLLLGRKTYDIFAAHWPRVAADDPIGRLFNGVTKYVATSLNGPLTWQHSVALHDPAKEVAQLKREDGPDLLTQGSSVLLKTLLHHGLIDEFRLLIFPVVLGRGKRLFGDVAMPAAMKLESSGLSSTGVVMATYRPDGEVRTGSFAID